jgi:hypothetical protein
MSRGAKELFAGALRGTRPGEFMGIRRGVWVALAGTILLTAILPLFESPLAPSSPRPIAPLAQPSSLRRQTFVRVPPSTQEIDLVEPWEAFKLDPPDPSEIPSLIAQLASPFPDERSAAAAKLDRFGFGAASAITKLTELAKKDPEDEVRHAAGEALLNIRGYVAPPRDF